MDEQRRARKAADGSSAQTPATVSSDHAVRDAPLVGARFTHHPGRRVGTRRRLATLPRRAFTRARYEGLGALMWTVLVKAASPLGDLGLRVFYEVDPSSLRLDRRWPEGVTVTRATLEDLDEIAAIEARKTRASKDIKMRPDRDIRRALKDRLDRGHLCFVAKSGGVIIHVNWVALRSDEGVPPGRFPPVLAGDEAYTYSGYTVDGWRGKGVHPIVLTEMLRHLRDTGIRRAYAQARLDNSAAWKPHARTGWTRSGLVLYFRPRISRVVFVWRLQGTLRSFIPGAGRFLVCHLTSSKGGER